MRFLIFTVAAVSGFGLTQILKKRTNKNIPIVQENNQPEVTILRIWSPKGGVDEQTIDSIASAVATTAMACMTTKDDDALPENTETEAVEETLRILGLK